MCFASLPSMEFSPNPIPYLPFTFPWYKSSSVSLWLKFLTLLMIACTFSPLQQKSDHYNAIAFKCGRHDGHTFPPFTSPKEEKYFVLLVSSPPEKLGIFISLGSSEISNLTLREFHLCKKQYMWWPQLYRYQLTIFVRIV